MELVEGIVKDGETLVRQQLDLFRLELKEEVEHAKRAAVAVGAGAGLLGLAGVLSGHMLVHLVRRTTGLPLWAAYGVTGGVLGALGADLLYRARREAAEAVPTLPRTGQALRENVTWLKQQATAG
jgi:hypothetical protein